MFNFERGSDLEMLNDSFLEELEKIKDMLDDLVDEDSGDGNSGYEGIEEDEDESEYEEVYGGREKGIKEYQEKFREYVERIKEGLEKVYRDVGKNKKNEGAEPEMKSPWERGHKLGCGCPGCTAYRDFHGIKLNENQNNQNYQSSQIRPDLKLARNKSKTNKYVEQETDSRPCGGKHYHLFHGDNAGMKSVLGNYTKRFNFRPMGY
jgi:hypothetical protein